jgi:CDP-paratose 2-epimerase
MPPSPTDTDPTRRVLVTGGAGFVGANLAIALRRRHPGWEIAALDNLRRRGSELNLPRLREAGIAFVHGDVRDPADLQALEAIDTLVECSAEPSVLAGTDGSPDYVVRTNLFGAYHCLELARRHDASVVFLSTSRVYPVATLEGLAHDEGPTRYELADRQRVPGASAAGVSEALPLDGPRSLYGTTKLSAELLIAEYRETYGLRAVVDRCGVIAGPWQFGKADQGVFTYWMLAHVLDRPLRYIGYGGSGKQVRDLLHIDDLVDLVDEQIVDLDRWDGMTVNVGGGRSGSLSLLETTELCRELSGRRIEVKSSPEPRPGDVRIYLSDCEALFAHTTWRPSRSPRDVLADTLDWISDHERAVLAAL